MRTPHVTGPGRNRSRPLALILTALLAAVALPGRADETFPLELRSGWNLVSVPIAPTDDTVAGVFQGKHLGTVWGWDAAAHRFHQAQTIAPGKGYWVYVPDTGRGEDSVVVSITGALPVKRSVTLGIGWNLAGPLPAYRYFTDSGLRLWKWNQNPGKYEQPALGVWEPGRGYWFHATQPTVVDFDTYTLSGQVTGEIIEDVTVTLTGRVSAQTTTASDGRYSFSGLRSGIYRVTPTFTNRAVASVTPESRSSIKVDGSDLDNIDFETNDAEADTSFMKLQPAGTQTFDIAQYAAAATVSTLAGLDVNDEEGTIRVSGRRRDGFAPGDVLIGDEATRFAKVVTTVELWGADTVLRVRDATLPEIMADGATFGFELTPDWRAADDLLADERGGRAGPTVTEGGSITFADFSLLDLDINSAGGIDWSTSRVMQIAVKPEDRDKAVKAARDFSPGSIEVKLISGTLQVVPTMRLNYNYTAADGISAQGTIDAHVVADFEISATLTGPVDAQLEGTLLKYNQPVTIPAEPPIYLDIEFAVPAGVILRAGASGSLTFRQRSEYTVRANLAYSAATGFTVAKTLDKTYGAPEFAPDVPTFAAVEFYLEPTVTVKLYKMVGPYLSLHPYLRGEIHFPLEADRDEVFLGITGTVGLERDYLFGTIDVNSGPLFDLCKSWDLVGPKTAGTVNTPPFARNQSVQIAKGQAKTLALTGSDADGDALVFSMASYPANGSLTGWNASTGQVTYAPKADYTGADAFTFRVHDGKAYSSTATVNIEVTAAQPPVAAFNVSTDGLAASFDASASFDTVDSASSLLVRWDYTDDGVWDTAWTTSKTGSHTYPRSGVFIAGCEVKNAAGLVAKTVRTVTVDSIEANMAPVAVFSVSVVGLAVSVDASASADVEDTAAGRPLNCRWRWIANGVWTAWTTARTASHTYSTAGSYDIQLEVRDSDDSISQAATRVTVSVDYLAIDVSAGPDASGYPVSYLATTPSDLLTNAVWRTTKILLRRVPHGTFAMGSPANELGRWDDEAQHQVTLTQNLYIGVFEVTQKQWERVMATWPSYFHNTSVRDRRPVEQVSYNDIRGSSAGGGWPANNSVDATSFMGRLRRKTGLTVDLPTESQWEHACRAGTTTALNNGANLAHIGSDANMDLLGRYWYNGGSEYSQNCGLVHGTAEVGSYLPNAWGLYDMHGNVWEWCLDWYGTYPGTVSEPRGPVAGSYRVRRGGGWNGDARDCRSARRYTPPPDPGSAGLGFRLAGTVQ